MGSITTVPMAGIEIPDKESTPTFEHPGSEHLDEITKADELLVCTDVEMTDAAQDMKRIMETKQPSSLRMTVLATRSTDAVIEELNVSTKNLKVKRSDSSISSSLSTNSHVSTRKLPQKHINGDIGAIAEELEDEENLAYSGDEGDAPLPEPTEDQERSRELEVLRSYLRTQEILAIKNPKKVAPELENQQSVRWLANNTGAGQIISTPREYQIELFEKAKEENIIAVLDTGSGKTLIAVLLLQHVINEELERRAKGMERKISFFLVDSVALVFQQAAVLRGNLGQNVAQICGEMGTDRWSKEPWIEYMENNMVIVLTAEVLYQCLHHSYISMNQISLLIFDEAHHAKRNHPYARIIKDFYISDDKDASELPRIFGMTASPVDARVDVEKAAMELESLLSCRILTSTDESMAQWQASKVKKELIAQYDAVGPTFQTPLFNQIYDKLKGMKECLKPLIFAKKASAELGAWAADEVFRVSYTPDEVEKMKINVETKFNKKNLTDTQPMEQLNGMLGRINEVASIVAQHTFEPPQFNPEHLSSKVITLVNYLRERYENPCEDKAIVFVSQRLTARLLTNLLSNPDIGTPHLRVGSLVGTRTSHGGGGDEVSFRSQMITLRRFRTGELNCLFATSVAEEGLDIPDCNLIIRFDLYTTVIQYIQSRGRARLANSIYIHMIEQGNGEHAASLRSARADSATLQAFYTKLPEDRKLMGNTHNLDYVLAKERAQTRTHREDTGAVLTYRMALSTLANFVASLTHKDDSIPNPEYVMGRKGDKFLCEVILPEASPISGAVGRPADTKQVAKCSAAFEACMALRRGQHLDQHLVSVYKNRGPLMRNARLALGSKLKKQYDMRTKPDLWKSGSIRELYLNVMHLQNPEKLDRPSQPIGLLTRGPLPRIPEFHLFFTKTDRSPLICTSVVGSLKFDEVTLEKLDMFTLKIFDDVYSKEYISDIEIMPYFIVPIVEDFAVRLDSAPNPSEIIAWDIIESAVALKYLPWDENTPGSAYEGLWVVDPMDGSRKLWTKKVNHELKPTSPIPKDAARREEKWYRIMKEEQEDKSAPPTIIQYSNSAWKKTRVRGRKWNESQPVIEADVSPLRRNFLDDSSIPDKAPITHCYICPEPLALSTIPPKVVAMSLMFPSILHRVESYLIALEAASMLNLPLAPELALECLTKDSSNTADHGEEQVAFQRGMGNNYERLEFYGDCFLKMATSISIYTLHPDGKELDFHVKRMLMICNQNLMNVAKKLRLHEYIRTEGFDRRSWYPEGLVLRKGNQRQLKNTHDLGDKTIADIPEALIGAALLTPGENHPMDHAVRAVTEVVCSTDHDVQKWADYYRMYNKPKYQVAPANASQVDLAQQVEAKHSYHFKHPRLLRSAFTHSTIAYIWAKVPNYQRLEFLGDSILDMVCVRYLFHLFPNKGPQWLTEHKMAMVSNQFLGALCVELGFHRHLQHNSSVITNGIVDYVAEFEEAKENAVKEALAAGKPETDIARDFWVHTKHPPKYLADMIEAYIGAVFVDSEFNYSEVERFFDEHMKWFFEDVALYDTFANNHPVTALNHFFERNMGCVKYRLNATQFPDTEEGMPPRVIATVMIHSQVICSAERESARYAKVACATEALDMLKGSSPAQFREKWKCDCKAKGRVEVTVGDEGEVRKEVKRQVDVRMRDYELTSTEETDSAGSRKPSVANG